jgi:NAD(P)-dependent dehydrogenase (short-subunit alcohol dehydrogenase family)
MIATAISEGDLVASYKLNTISAYRMSMACLPHLLKARNASLTSFGSLSSTIPAYDTLAYGTTKAAQNQKMVSLDHLLAKKVRVYSILIGRTGQPEGMANSMLWPCSSAGGFVEVTTRAHNRAAYGDALQHNIENRRRKIPWRQTDKADSSPAADHPQSLGEGGR